MQKIVFYKNIIQAVEKAEQVKIEIKDKECSMIVTFASHNNAHEEVTKPSVELLKLMSSQSRVIGEINDMLMNVEEIDTDFSQEVDNNAHPVWAKCKLRIEMTSK